MPSNAPDYVLSTDIAEVIFIVHTPEMNFKAHLNWHVSGTGLGVPMSNAVNLDGVGDPLFVTRKSSLPGQGPAAQ